MILLLLACADPDLKGAWSEGPTLTVQSTMPRAEAAPTLLFTGAPAGAAGTASLGLEVELEAVGAAAELWAWLYTPEEATTTPDVASPLAYGPITLVPEDGPTTIETAEPIACVFDAGADAACTVDWRVAIELRAGAAANVGVSARPVLAFTGELDPDASTAELTWGR